MKIIKGLAVFFVVWILFAACFSTPEFSNSPSISFDSKDNLLYFTPSPSDTSSIKDSLVFEIGFTDGDGDLGLDATTSDTPYNPKNYYLADGKGGVRAIGTFSGNITDSHGNITDVLNPILDVPSNYKGKLVTVRTRKQAGYDSFPSYPSVKYPCRNYDYSFDSVFVLESDTAVFNKSYYIKRITKTTPRIYVLQDTLYYQPNPGGTNISVEFIMSDGTTFDWRQHYCEDFNQRFPVLADKSRPLQGKLRYGMASKGFSVIFGSNNPIMLKVTIKDRALHVSNQITIGPFSLNSIRKK